MGWSEKYKKSIDCNNPKGFSQRAHCQGKKKKMQEGNLHHWFKGSKSKDGKPGWVQSDGSPCANEPGETKTPKCYSSARLAALKRKGKKGENLIKSADRRKREQDPGQQSKSGAAKPTNVKTFAKGKKNKHYVKPEPGLKETMEMQEGKDVKGKGSGKKDACYHKVKASAKVWPSAYASGRLVQCRKKGASNWGNKSEEWVAQTAAEYLFNEGLNEDGVEIFIEELGLESFVEFVYDLAEDEYLTEARAARRRKGGKSYEQVKAEIDAREKAKAAKKSAKTSAKPAAETAKKQQPKKRPVLDGIARQVLKGMERHKAAMAAARETGKTISKAAKVGAKGAQEFGKGFKSGVETAGKVAKIAKKAVSENYQYSDWRDEFKAMEYEFIDLIKPEPLVTEASFEINPQKHREEVRAKKIRDRTKTGDEGSEIAKKKVKGPKLMGEEQIDELKCWKGYKRKKGAVPGAKGSCVKENEDVIDEARRAKKARNPKSYKEVKKEIDNKEFRAGKLTPAQKHEIEKKENLKSTSSFSRHRMTGSGGHGSDYHVNPRISYIRNQYEIENELDESKRTSTKSDLEVNIGGGNLKTLVGKSVKRVDYDVDGDVDPNDKVEKKTGNYGEELPTPFGKFRTGDSKKVKVKKEEVSNWRDELDEKLNLKKTDMGDVVKDFYDSDAPQFKGKSKEKRREMAIAAKLSAMREDWQKVNKGDKTDGMSAAAVKAYRRENPGSKLKTAVTGDPKPGSKDAKRRKSFCARSKGQQDMHNIDCSKTPDKPVCKARRRWKC